MARYIIQREEISEQDKLLLMHAGVQFRDTSNRVEASFECDTVWNNNGKEGRLEVFVLRNGVVLSAAPDIPIIGAMKFDSNYKAEMFFWESGYRRGSLTNPTS